jgi:membrane protease YdiL (CAAX protease family)
MIPAVILYLTHYILIPAYVDRSGVPYFFGYLGGYVITMGMFFVAALVGYRQEGHPIHWGTFKTRFRLKKIDRADALWIVLIIIFVLVTYFGLGFTGGWVKSVPFLAPRDAWPPEFGPGGTGNITPGRFMELPLKGQWWVVVVYFIGWFFNIVGEELWFRSYILPRQEMAFGRTAWLVNGLMFALNHIWQPWIILAILPSSLLLAYVLQTRKNTWIAILQHGFVNLGLLFFLIGGVIG